MDNKNLTLQQNLLRDHEGLDSLPGYVLVVYEKLDGGGAIFYRLVNPGERFQPRIKIPFLSSLQKYFAVAVNQSIVRFKFEQIISMDDALHKFTLICHLSCRVSDPVKISELRDRDPLWQLQEEISQVMGRSIAQREWEMVRDRFRDLEIRILDGTRDRLRQYAATLGLDILSIELDRTLPDNEIEIERERIRAETAKKKLEIQNDESRYRELINQDRDVTRKLRGIDDTYTVREKELDKRIELQIKEELVHRSEMNRKLREDQTEAIGTAVKHVGQGITTPAELRDGYEVAVQISNANQDSVNSGYSGSSLSSGTTGYLPSAPDGDFDEILRLLRSIDQWPCGYAQKQALRSAILHLEAESLLEDDTDEAIIQKYVGKLAYLGKSLQGALSHNQFQSLQGLIRTHQSKVEK